MSDIKEIMETAKIATERAHSIVARLDRTIFRQQVGVDPTPEVWFVHHTINEAFKAFVRSKTACNAALEAELFSKDVAAYNKACKECEHEAELAIFLAAIVEERLKQMEAETGH
jgi:hypothetical protein